MWRNHPEKVLGTTREFVERYPRDPDAATGVAHVMRTGESELYAELLREQVEVLSLIGDIADGPLNRPQVIPGPTAQVGFFLKQCIGVQRYWRYRVVDVMSNAAGHLAQSTQPFLLHYSLLRLAQIVIGLLQG